MVSASDKGYGFVPDFTFSYLIFVLESSPSNLYRTHLWSLSVTLNPSYWFTAPATSDKPWPDSLDPALNWYGSTTRTYPNRILSLVSVQRKVPP